MTESLKIAIAGLGTVGASVFKLLEGNADIISKRTSDNIEVIGVSARDKSKNRGINIDNVKWYDNPVDIADDKDVDIVVELIGGCDGAAFDLIKKSLENGKQVVTANKALLASRSAEILELLEKNDGVILYEAAIAGTLPIVKTLREGLAANNINAVYGILNGTGNFILSEMSATGRDFEDVLAEAQEKGYAEVDPSFDIDGIDTGHKISILSGLAFGVVPDFKNMRISGIRDITSEDIKFADELGYNIKLLGIAYKTANGIEQSVEACLVPKTSAIGTVGGALNAVYIDGDYCGNVLMTGAGAGGDETASAVVADIIDLARGISLKPLLGTSKLEEIKLADINKRIGSYFLRLRVLDKPGVIAEISGVLRDCNVSLESVLQRSREPNQPVSVILTSHETSEGSMATAVDKISKLEAVIETPHLMRIENFV